MEILDLHIFDMRQNLQLVSDRKNLKKKKKNAPK